MATPSIRILGTGAHAPTRVLTNAELSAKIETSDEWIVTRSGIRERRVAGPEEATSDMAVAAARAALADAGIAASEIDLLVLATVTPDLTMPASACSVQHKLGLPHTTACFDLSAACSGFVYGLDTAAAMVQSGRYKRALLIGSEKLSTIIDWSDRTTCVLFGDGAAAVVLGPSDASGAGLIDVKLGAYGDSLDLLYVPKGGSTHPPTAESIAAGDHFIKMKGKELFKLAVRAMAETARDILAKNGLTSDDIGLIIPHQANQRIIEAVAKQLQLPLERFFVNVDRYGNTSAASIPIAIDEARRSGRIRPGDVTLLVAFGAGLTYGSALVRW
ncbi:3-oxoacyl-ACP synthase [Cephaloticoccus primus]|uniref:Beta-ketoacyl-[acyl-carrier-protein] synthase III n=1 Tax=Cephaloticoccus primus TaxID=1548207 RepID=A0A139SN63_9BACT|nr:beta-ketoacyl-ACP synthase III [Cephaloticoccus primus]KXU35904.1 3-oxoacyl-ACP synthase [Cephaloticoccus primus]